MKPLTFEISGRVASAKNSTRRAMVRGRMLTLKSKAAGAWQAHAVAELTAQRPVMRPIDTPVRLAIQLHGPLGHGHSVDGDNAEGAVWDALKAAKVIDDDGPMIARACSWEWLEAPTWKVVLMLAPYQEAA